MNPCIVPTIPYEPFDPYENEWKMQVSIKNKYKT